MERERVDGSCDGSLGLGGGVGDVLVWGFFVWYDFCRVFSY